MLINYLIHVAITICYYTILVVSLNLALGYTGILNLGHVAFFAIGAYTSAILTMHGVPFAIAFCAAPLVAGAFGFLLTVLTNRLKGDYVALATLGFSFVTVSVINNWRSLTRGPYGIPGIEKPNIFGWYIHSNAWYLLFVFIIAALIVFLVYRITHSRYGTLLEAVRDDAIGIVALGKNVFKLKYQAMMISAACAGIAGSIFAHYITYVHPSNFFLADIILLISIVIVGGLASVKGSVAGTALLIFLTESLRFIDLPSSIVGPARLIMYSVLLLVILMYRPRGLFGRIDLS